MSLQDIQCSMCGQRYDPEQHLACQACPMNSGCNLVCCPACGYQTVDPGRSKIVRLARFFSKRRSRSGFTHRGRMCLADVPPGCKAEVVGFSAGFPPDRRAYLQAYGLVVNYWVQVLQHNPVTIVRLDHIELALENDLARGIIVQLSTPDPINHPSS
jgi:hypothetical protein